MGPRSWSTIDLGKDGGIEPVCRRNLGRRYPSEGCSESIPRFALATDTTRYGDLVTNTEDDDALRLAMILVVDAHCLVATARMVQTGRGSSTTNHAHRWSSAW